MPGGTGDEMMMRSSEQGSVNVLLSDAHWAWPQAVAEIFHPQGINPLVAQSADEMVRLVRNNRIHLAILDSYMEELTGVQVLRMLRRSDPELPCILLAQEVSDRLLERALSLDAFSVLAKPVDLRLLAEQVDRLFVKHYKSDIFASGRTGRGGTGGRTGISTFFRLTIRKNERSYEKNEDQTSGE